MAARPRRVIVVGAGAAGTMAAIFAARPETETVLLERTPDGARKILISGGGRCNILPARVDESRFVTDSSPNTLKKMLRSWRLEEQIAFFEREAGIPLAEETESGKLFPVSNRASDVRDALFAMARRRGARIVTGALVTGIRKQDAAWLVEQEGAPPREADAVVVATGGLSIPKSGSDGVGLEFLRSLGHTIRPTYPALTPLTGASPDFRALAGISLPVAITARAQERSAGAEGGFLFTHQGYSGPSVLDVSHVAVRSLDETAPARVTVRWTKRGRKEWEAALRGAGNRTVGSVLRDELPDRLAAALSAASAADPATPLARLTRETRMALVETLAAGALPWSGHGGYAKAEVTGGGVALEEIHPATMESRLHPGLFLCGEALDAFGPIGGYNFLWAWATGRAAGISAGAPPVSQLSLPR